MCNIINKRAILHPRKVMHKKVPFCLLITHTLLNTGFWDFFYETPAPQQTQPRTQLQRQQSVATNVTNIPASTAPVQVIVNNHNAPYMDNSSHMQNNQSAQ